MKAIEIISKTDKKGYLNINYRLDKSDENVRVLILLDDKSETDDEKIWMDSNEVSLESLYGSWVSEQSGDEMAEDLKKSRNFNRQRERL